LTRINASQWSLNCGTILSPIRLSSLVESRIPDPDAALVNHGFALEFTGTTGVWVQIRQWKHNQKGTEFSWPP